MPSDTPGFDAGISLDGAAGESRVPDQSQEPRRSGRDGTMIYGYTAAQLWALAWECAGVGSGAVMEQASDVVCPTEAIDKGIRRVMLERAILAPGDHEPRP